MYAASQDNHQSTNLRCSQSMPSARVPETGSVQLLTFSACLSVLSLILKKIGSVCHNSHNKDTLQAHYEDLEKILVSRVYFQAFSSGEIQCVLFMRLSHFCLRGNCLFVTLNFQKYIIVFDADLRRKVAWCPRLNCSCAEVDLHESCMHALLKIDQSKSTIMP